MTIANFSRSCGGARIRTTAAFRLAVACMLAVQLACTPFVAGAAGNSKTAPVATASSDPVLNAMQTELSRATTELGKQEQPPYYLSYTVYDQNYVVLVGSYLRRSTSKKITPTTISATPTIQGANRWS